jgi:hypothetical protein
MEKSLAFVNLVRPEVSTIKTQTKSVHEFESTKVRENKKERLYPKLASHVGNSRLARTKSMERWSPRRCSKAFVSFPADKLTFQNLLSKELPGAGEKVGEFLRCRRFGGKEEGDNALAFGDVDSPLSRRRSSTLENR